MESADSVIVPAKREHGVYDKRKIKPKVHVVGWVAALAGLAYGWDIGGSGGTFVMDGFRDWMGWPPNVDTPTVADEQGWITSMVTIGALVGCLPSGIAADRYGRRYVLMGMDLVFAVGCVVMFAAYGYYMLLLGRFIVGFAIGFMSNTTGMYQSECVPVKVRGFMVTLYQLCITFGIFLAGLMNLLWATFYSGWRFSYGGNIVFLIGMYIGMFWTPESPRYFVMRGKIERARRSLKVLLYEDQVEEELGYIMEDVRLNKEAGIGTWCDTCRIKNGQLYRTHVGVMIMFFQQMSGINMIMYFAPSIISSFWGTQAALYGNLAIQFVNFAATFICVFWVDKVGRWPMFTSGAAGMAIGNFFVAILAGPWLDYETNDVIGFLIVGGCMWYVIFFAYSWGPLGWVVTSEIQPTNIRAKAMTISTATNWICNTFVGKMSPILYAPENMDLWGTFLFFGCFCVAAFIWVWILVPETKGIALEDMELMFREFKPGCGIKRKWKPKGQAAPRGSISSVSDVKVPRKVSSVSSISVKPPPPPPRRKSSSSS